MVLVSLAATQHINEVQGYAMPRLHTLFSDSRTIQPLRFLRKKQPEKQGHSLVCNEGHTTSRPLFLVSQGHAEVWGTYKWLHNRSYSTPIRPLSRVR